MFFNEISKIFNKILWNWSLVIEMSSGDLYKSPGKALKLGLGPCKKWQNPWKMAKKWPGHFSRKSRILSYKPRLLAWAFWAQIRAQEQKIRSKSELRPSLEPSVNTVSKWNFSKSFDWGMKSNHKWIQKEGLWASDKLNKSTQISSELFQSPGWAFLALGHLDLQKHLENGRSSNGVF